MIDDQNFGAGPHLARIADALERIAERLGPPPSPSLGLDQADAFAWSAEGERLDPVAQVARINIRLLKGIDRVRDLLLENTARFAQGLPANNALLWGARGMGKSSLVKAIHGDIVAKNTGALKLIEIHREDIQSLPLLMRRLRDQTHRCLLFCDDLSFDAADSSYKSLKAVLDGGIEGRPAHILLYATSNRRHLMPRDMVENEQSTAINPAEAVEEKVSLSDRFGLWLGFHSCSQDEYLAMIEAYIEAYNLPVEKKVWRADAITWTATRGARSGRVAWQFITDLAGRLGVSLSA
jgi:predicted AAA+ superfamily ATPase